MTVILDLRNVTKTFTLRAGGWRKPVQVTACRDVNLQVERGKTLAVVGESGSGRRHVHGSPWVQSAPMRAARCCSIRAADKSPCLFMT